MQLGWCTLQTHFSKHEGVGDDQSSYAYDGYRVKKWSGGHADDYGEYWAAGDIIGCGIDLQNREIYYWRNNRFLGVAFSEV